LGGIWVEHTTLINTRRTSYGDTKRRRTRVDAALVGEVAQELREFAKAGLRDDRARRRLRLLERSPILRRLTPVPVAGGDSKAQYEYLIQAIIDAVDIIGRSPPPAPVPASSPASESRPDAH